MTFLGKVFFFLLVLFYYYFGISPSPEGRVTPDSQSAEDVMIIEI